MSLWRNLQYRCGTFLQRKVLDAEMDEEIRLHLEHRIEENIRQGMGLREARQAARQSFGGIDQIKEEMRDLQGWVWLENLHRDVRFSVHSLRRSARFSLAVIITLALCIGANTTIFSALYGLVLKPLPYPNPGQLVEIYNSSPKPGISRQSISVSRYLDYRQNADRFEGFALWQEAGFTLGGTDDPARVIGARVTADYFTLLGLQPLLGHFYTMEQCVPGQDNVVVLTQTLWETRFHSDPGIIGRTVHITGVPCTVVGVAPRNLSAINMQAVLFRPFTWNAAQGPTLNSVMGERLSHLYARVKAGGDPSEALGQLTALDRQFYNQVAPPALRDRLNQDGYRVELGQVRAEQTKPVKTALLLLQGAVFFVLLLGCVNVASLMLARANARQVELAIRQALGAGRWALARQLFVESLLLATLGASLGLTAAWSGLHVVNPYTLLLIPQAPPLSMDGTVLGVTLVVSFMVALLTGLLPALRLWHNHRHSPIQGGSPARSSGGRIHGASGLLVIVQVALALVLLVGAGLLIRSFTRVLALDPGFDAVHIVHARVAFNLATQDAATAHATGDRIVARMREIPGVDSVSITSHIPVNGEFNQVILPVNAAPGPKSPSPNAWYFGVSPEFFATMGMPIIAGRDFTAADNLPRARRTLVVDRDFAEKYFPGRNAVGQVFNSGNPNMKPDQLPIVIGVVEAARLNGPEDRSGLPFVFAPVGVFQFTGFSLEVRTARPLAEVAPLMLAQLHEVDPRLPLYQVDTLQSMLDRTMDYRRGVMILLGAFASVALLLSAVGIYGILAYDVTQRTPEIGIRRSIGASRRQILALILGQGLWKAGLGLLLGLAGAVYLSRFISGLLFDVRPSDPVSYLVVSLLLLLVALAASYLPARRASKIDPIVALRCE